MGAAREDIARLALAAERIPAVPKDGSLVTALHEAVRALDAAEEHIAVAGLRARRVAAAAKEAPDEGPGAGSGAAKLGHR